MDGSFSALIRRALLAHFLAHYALIQPGLSQTAWTPRMEKRGSDRPASDTVKHLHRLPLGEFDDRFSTRKMSDSERMLKVMGQVEGRLTWWALVNR